MSSIIENFKKLEDKVDCLINRYQSISLADDFCGKKNEYKNDMIIISNDLDCIISKIDDLILFIGKFDNNNIIS